MFKSESQERIADEIATIAARAEKGPEEDLEFTITCLLLGGSKLMWDSSCKKHRASNMLNIYSKVFGTVAKVMEDGDDDNDTDDDTDNETVH